MNPAKGRRYKQSLSELFPSVAKEWHPENNGKLTPNDVTPFSNKKVWWKCKKGHEWQENINNRSHGRNCPFCSGHRACDDNCLETINPKLAEEWHPKNNVGLTPKDVTPGSSKKVWWICDNSHEWQASVNSRSRGRRCPYCSGRRVCTDNCLQTVNPSLAKEWHPTKNGKLTPNDVTPNSHKKMWWTCNRGHEWQAVINSRNRGSNCPFCHSQTSQLELRIFTELKYIINETKHRKKVSGYECDIFIPELGIGIEIDSYHWHKDKNQFDKNKQVHLMKEGIILFRLREKGLKKISNYDIFYSRNDDDFSLVKKLLYKIIKQAKVKDKLKSKILNYFNRDELSNNDEYLKLVYILPSPLPGYSLADKNETLATEWHPNKNGSLTSKDVAPFSNKKVWWRCEIGHEWQDTVNNRSHGQGCPYCSGHRVCEDNCLQTLNPSLAREWYQLKNSGMTPKDVTLGSHIIAWWICDKGHLWRASVKDRSQGNGCPYCAGRRVSVDNCLETVNPKLAQEWHPTKNGDLSPRKVTANSGHKVWWKCKKGHEWEAFVYSRSKGAECPFCSGRKASKNYCLESTNPELAKEWHPTKNGRLTPEDVTPGSDKKAWWKCKENHEWRAYVYSRNKGIGCPYCTGQKVCEDNCLQTVNPELAREWHHTKNGGITPNDVTQGSNKKAWWTCNNGHEWRASIKNRSNGTGCPYCSSRKKWVGTSGSQ